VNTISEFKHNRWLAKEFDVKEAVIAPTLATEIMPVVIVGNIERDPYQGSATDDYLVGCGQLFLGVVTNATFQIINPIGSGIVLTLDALLLCTSVPADVVVSTDAADFAAGPTTQSSRLFRRPPQIAPPIGRSFISASSQATVAGSGSFTFRNIGNTTYDVSSIFRGFVLDEGGVFTIQEQTAASTLYVNFRARETVKIRGK